MRKMNQKRSLFTGFPMKRERERKKIGIFFPQEFYPSWLNQASKIELLTTNLYAHFSLWCKHFWLIPHLAIAFTRSISAYRYLSFSIARCLLLFFYPLHLPDTSLRCRWKCVSQQIFSLHISFDSHTVYVCLCICKRFILHIFRLHFYQISLVQSRCCHYFQLFSQFNILKWLLLVTFFRNFFPFFPHSLRSLFLVCHFRHPHTHVCIPFATLTGLATFFSSLPLNQSVFFSIRTNFNLIYSCRISMHSFFFQIGIIVLAVQKFASIAKKTYSRRSISVVYNLCAHVSFTHFKFIFYLYPLKSMFMHCPFEFIYDGMRAIFLNKKMQGNVE